MQRKLWETEEIRRLFEMPFISLLSKAHTIHEKHFDPNEIELCTIVSVKTGACPEDCSYCSQSGHYQTEIPRDRLWPLEKVIAEAKLAKEKGATRFCMGAAWRSPPQKSLPKIIEMIKAVKEVGLETCVTLGMLDDVQAQQLKVAGLDFYNHNLDTSPAHYPNIITTRTFEDRLDTLNKISKAKINVCCGGILGMGENREDRVALIHQLANLETPPLSVPINRLIPFKGTPLENAQPIDNIEFIRTIAIARITIPRAMIRLSAGRENMTEEMQALCFFAGANSMWLGKKLLTANNREQDDDLNMLAKFGMHPKTNTPTVSAFIKTKPADLIRERPLVNKTKKTRVNVEQQSLINFCSNDYLDLANDSRVKAALIEGAEKYGFGSGASPVVAGFTKAHQELEERFANFFKRERALIFNSGYHANLGVLTTFANKEIAIVADKFCHASLIDGARLSRAKFYRYPHRDLESASSLLQQHEKALLVSESIFSMEGSIADINALTKLAKNYKAMLIIDDAHGVGVLGETGGGICQHANISELAVPCIVAPLGKAIGGFGAVVSGSHDLIESLMQHARTYSYSTLLPAALCHATITSLKLLETEVWRREKLQHLIAYFEKCARESRLPFISNDATPIKCLLVGDNQKALALQKNLKEKGIFVSCIRPPSVAKGTARLRICLSAAMEEKQIDQLFFCLNETKQ